MVPSHLTSSDLYYHNPGQTSMTCDNSMQILPGGGCVLIRRQYGPTVVNKAPYAARPWQALEHKPRLQQ